MWRSILVGLVVACGLKAMDDEPKPDAPYERLLKGDDSKKAAELEKKIEEAEQADQYDEAINLSEEFLALRTKVQGADHWQTVNERWALDGCRKVAGLPAAERAGWRKALEDRREARRMDADGHFAKSQPLFEEYVRWCLRVFGENHTQIAAGYNFAALNLKAQGKYAEAQPLFQKALELQRELLGESHPVTATSFNNVATVLDDLGKSVEAQPLHQKALNLRLQLLGENHPQIPQSLNNLAFNLEALGKHGEAQPFYQRALDLRLETIGEKHRDTARSYANLASNLSAQARHADAQPLMQKALDIYLELVGERHPDTLRSLGNLATIVSSQGKYPEAQPLLQKALELTREVQGEKHPETVSLIGNLASNLNAQVKYADAQPLYQMALDLHLERFGELHPATIRSYHRLAANLYAQGKYADAQRLFQKELDLRLELQGESHADTAASYDDLAVILNAQGKHGDAEQLFRKALDLRRKLLGETNLSTAESYGNLAGSLGLQGKYVEAELLQRHALEMYLELLGEKHHETAMCYNNLAGILDAQGKYADAQSLHEKALELFVEQLGETHPDTLISYNNLAANLHSQLKYAEAEERLVQGAATYETARLKVANRGLDRAILGAERSPYRLLAVIQAIRQSPNAGWVAAETNLGRGLSDELASRRGTTLTPSELRQQAELNAKLSKLQPRILQLVLKQMSSDAEMDELSKLQSERSTVETQLAALAVALSQREITPLSTVQSAISADAALVLWVDFTSRGGDIQEHWGCVVRRTGDPAWERLPGGNTETAWTDKDSVLSAKLGEALASGTSAAADVHALAKALHNQRIAPLARHLDGVKTLYVVAVDQMAGIPIELLTDKYTISYVPSGTFLARLKEKAPPAGSSLLALADPVFDRSDKPPSGPKPLPPGGLLITIVAPESAASAARLQPRDVLLSYAGVDLTSVEKLTEAIAAKAEASRVASAPGVQIPITVWREGEEKPFTRTVPPGRLGVALDKEPAPQAIANRRKTEAMLLALRGGDWKELPGTRVELTQIAKLFGPDASTLLDSAASEQSLDDLRKNGDLSKFRYLHFATHGDANNVRALESVLVLAQDTLPKDPLPRAGEPFINGQLSANEVLEFWNLNADLVTLSACETALGRPGGGDGLLGFAQAFLTAGSRAVCLSLWKVDDTATALLMNRFYQNLLGKRPGLDQPMPKAAALAEAKQWLRELSAEEALKLTAAATGGVVRGSRGKGEELKLVVPAVDPKNPTAKDVKPFAHPRFWSAFILIGDPN